MNEQEKLKLLLKFYGYETGDEVLFINSDLMRLAKSLSVLPNCDIVNGFKIDKEQTDFLIKKFFQGKLRLHDIMHIDEKDYFGVYKVFYEKFANNGNILLKNDFDWFIDEISKKTKIISPYDLPVKSIRGHSMIGNISKPLLEISDFSLLEKQEILFSSINLGDNYTLLSVCTIIHEIIHIQLESVKGSVKNYLNREVLSIFFEKIAALEFDESKKLLKLSESMRYNYLYHSINKLKLSHREACLKGISYKDRIEDSISVNSTLLADKLFDFYINVDEFGKKDIMNGIQMIFDGKQTLEEFLEKFNIKLEKEVYTKIIKKIGNI